MSNQKAAQCAVCGRKLTSEASIAAGVGPVCGQTGGKGKKHRLPRLRKLPIANPAGGSFTTAEALAAVRQVAEKSPTWEAVAQ